MSYLLTEIALEMLGYKFYDTNGVFHLTNFQQSMTAVQNDVHPDEPSLLDFIHQPSNCNAEQNVISEKSLESSDESFSDPLTKPFISVDLRRAPIRALAKMMKYESEKALNGLAQSLRETATTSNTERYQRQCLTLTAEKNKIIEDAINMKKFRFIVEERLRRINPRPYATYQKTFGVEL
ncbi:hypothetical protein KR044_011659 [Drosophila immigrans]|nr:hypothetical protein KR044_011659 [Drosophila immigrans]